MGQTMFFTSASNTRMQYSIYSLKLQILQKSKRRVL